MIVPADSEVFTGSGAGSADEASLLALDAALLAGLLADDVFVPGSLVPQALSSSAPAAAIATRACFLISGFPFW
jgi:hypothetical protein